VKLFARSEKQIKFSLLTLVLCGVISLKKKQENWLLLKTRKLAVIKNK
jgi:hypothetical protein